MILVLGFGLPFALYVIWSVWAVRIDDAQRRAGSNYRLGAHFVATVAALVCTVVVFIAVGRGPNKSKTLSWSGVQCPAAGCQDLRIGGDPSGGGLGWPNGSFSPEVSFQLRGGSVELQMLGGGGFVLCDDEPLNGVALDPLSGGTFAGYSLTPAGCGGNWRRLLTALSRWDFFGRQCAPQIAFHDVGGGHVATASLSAPARNRSRPARLSDLVARPRQLGWVERMLADPSPVPMPTPGFMEWASSVLVYRHGDSPVVHFLGRDAFRATVAVDDTVRIVWPGRTSESVAFSVDPLFRLGFSRPYRRSSPVADSSSRLHDFVLTTAPRPGDYAFLLPLGLSERDPRLPMRLVENKPADRFEPLPEHVLDRATVLVAAGAVTLDLRDDAFTVGAVRWRLPVLLAVFAIAAFSLARSSSSTLHRVRLCGLLLGTWMLLMLRAVLALRYVFPPAPIDWLAVKGVLFSFWPLLLLPLTLAALAVGQMEATHGAARKSRRLRSILVTVGALGSASLLTLPSSLWRPLPEKLVIDTVQHTLALAVLAVLLLAWIGMPGRARSVVAKLIDRWQRHYAALPAPSGRFRDSFNDFPRSGRSILLMFVVTVGVVAVAKLVSVARSEVFLRDIVIHGVWLWFPAILWLGALSSLRAGRGMVRPVVWTVAIAALVTPFVSGDPGSVISAGAVFLALALILFHYRKAAWASLAITAVLVLGLVVAVVFYVTLRAYSRRSSLPAMPPSMSSSTSTDRRQRRTSSASPPTSQTPISTTGRTKRWCRAAGCLAPALGRRRRGGRGCGKTPCSTTASMPSSSLATTA